MQISTPHTYATAISIYIPRVCRNLEDKKEKKKHWLKSEKRSEKIERGEEEDIEGTNQVVGIDAVISHRLFGGLYAGTLPEEASTSTMLGRKTRDVEAGRGLPTSLLFIIVRTESLILLVGRTTLGDNARSTVV